MNIFGLFRAPTDAEVALSLSDEWKIRALNCKKDLERLISIKQTQVEKMIEDEHYESVEREMENSFQMQVMVNELTEILEKYKTYPLPYEVVERISLFERENYKRTMTEQMLVETMNNVQEGERITRIAREIGVKVDEMWNDNVSEESIQEYVFRQVLSVHPNLNSEDVREISNSLYTALTAGRNVRVNLSEEQISSLKKCKGNTGTCHTCLEDYNRDEEMICLNCPARHAFHPDCIIPWLKRSVFCPVCKHDLRKSS